MGTKSLVVRDVRLHGYRPKGDHVLEVNFDTPLSWPIDWAQKKAKEYKGDVHLKIMAHGTGMEIECKAEEEDRKARACRIEERHKKCKFSQGGGGILFCREWIRPGTLHMFKPLRDKLKGIDLLACGTAYITPGYNGKRGDGNYLCYRMAQITKTYVRASSATQYYFPKGNDDAIDFGRWEGTVLTYGPKGNVVKVQTSPEK